MLPNPVNGVLTKILIACVVVLIGIGGTLGVLYHLEKKSHEKLVKAYEEQKTQIQHLENTNGLLKSEIQSKSDALENYLKSRDQQEQTRAEITKESQRKETAIIERYRYLEKTEANKEAEANELSEVRIDAIWRNYCLVEPAAIACRTL